MKIEISKTTYDELVEKIADVVGTDSQYIAVETARNIVNKLFWWSDTQTKDETVFMPI